MKDLGDAYGWNFDFRQLEPGPLAARTEVFQAAELNVMRVQMDRSFHQLGGPVPGAWTFGVMDADLPAIDWCGGQLRAQDIVDFNDPNGYDGVSCSMHRATTFTLSDRLLQAKADALGVDVNARLPLGRGGKISLLAPTSTALMRHRFQLMFSDFEYLDSRGQSALVNDLEDFLSTMVLVSAARPDAGRHGISSRNGRQQICRRAVSYLDANIQLPVTVSDLCREANVSIATLERAFRAYFGVTPKRYIMHRRLTAVARAIRENPDRPVTEIAGL